MLVFTRKRKTHDTMTKTYIAVIYIGIAHSNEAQHCLHFSVSRGRIFSHVRPFYERAVSNLDRSMHRFQWL